MAYRATKSGLAREAQSKILEKYSVEDANQVMEWLNRLLNLELDTSGDSESVMLQLKDGSVLIKLARKLGMKGNAILDKDNSSAFKCMEKINAFTAFTCSEFKVKPEDTFQTVDLYEAANPTQVVCSLAALARKVGKDFGGFGPKEADKNERQFTEEQRRAGQQVIGLQMGTNKGASQAGMNFGKARKIVD